MKGKSFSVDLDGMGFVDDQRKALLTEMDRAGVELVANGWMMRSTIQQIVVYGVNLMMNAAEHD